MYETNRQMLSKNVNIFLMLLPMIILAQVNVFYSFYNKG